MMEAVASVVTEWPRPLAWLREFLKEELAPYPGRGPLVARMVIAATLVMLIAMTFRLPFGVQAIYALVVARETHWGTVRAVRKAVLILAVAAGYGILGTMVSLGDPMLRTLWVIVSLFIAFFAIRIISDYGAAVGFGILVGLSIPILDQHISAELKVTRTLWAAGQTMFAAIIAALVALLFAGLKPGDFLLRSIAERLASVEELLHGYAAGQPVEDKAKKITRMAMLGTSRLRGNIQRSGYSLHYAEQMGVVVVLVGRLVDMAANLVSLDVRISEEDRLRNRILAETIAGLRSDLLASRIPRLSQSPVDCHVSSTMPVLAQMEKTVSLIADAFVDSKSMSTYASVLSNEGDPPESLFVRNALTNSEHLKFALKGCLAASLCYIIYTALDWPGISTAVLTCIVTALTTIGSSRQKQVLRISGAIAGGLVIGMGAQIFILPHLDSIAGFTLLFIAVTILAGWLATSGPRLSYFGVQLAMAFYLINLQEFKIETSLTLARDRVVGILLGLFMMWLVFDQLWSAPTVVQMRKTFISVFRSLAQLIRQPASNNSSLNIERSYSLRETINSSFNQVRALADALWFEFGPSRQQDLALRSRILGWQAQLRMLFISCVALVKYRLRFLGFELPDSVRLAEQEFDECLARALDGMADRLEGKASDGTQNLEAAFVRLRDSVGNSLPAEASVALTANLKAFLPLSERITGLAVSLDKELAIRR